jgi:hypothetical protein
MFILLSYLGEETNLKGVLNNTTLSENLNCDEKNNNDTKTTLELRR